MSNLLKVTEITVALGATIPVGGPNSYEFARIDISNKAVFNEPVETGSKEYRLAHKELVQAVDLMVEKAKAELIKDEE